MEFSFTLLQVGDQDPTQDSARLTDVLNKNTLARQGIKGAVDGHQAYHGTLWDLSPGRSFLITAITNPDPARNDRS